MRGHRSAIRRQSRGALCALTLLLGGCYSTTLDLDELQQPVTMSPSAIAHRTDTSPGQADVGSYAALRAYQFRAILMSSQMAVADDAQAAAFEQIGGDPRRAVTGVRLHVDFTGSYLVLAALARVQIRAEGSVVELDGEVDE